VDGCGSRPNQILPHHTLLGVGEGVVGEQGVWNPKVGRKVWKMNWTKAWLAEAKVTDNPVGDLIADMRRDADPKLPEDFPSVSHLKSYLYLRGACREALAVARTAWRRYRAWRDKAESHAKEGTV
jgi:hypothetical protein